jgi:pectate disaccharide-lyase
VLHISLRGDGDLKTLTKVWSIVLSLALLLSTAPMMVSPSNAAEGTNASQLKWESITFGQSTDLSFAPNVLPEKVGTNYAHPDNPGTIDGDIILESRGGKLAPGHDGLTFYYTKLDPKVHNFVLEADITIDQFGPEQVLDQTDRKVPVSW